MTFSVRLAQPHDLPALESIERQASQRFDASALVAGLQKQTVPMQQLVDAVAGGTLWVVATMTGNIAGFLLAEKLDAALHVCEMGVVPAQGRRGMGAALLNAAKRYAKDAGYANVTLTTYRSVPWNAPFYFKQSFFELSGHDIGPELALRLEQEHALGLRDRISMCWREDAAVLPQRT